MSVILEVSVCFLISMAVLLVVWVDWVIQVNLLEVVTAAMTIVFILTGKLTG